MNDAEREASAPKGKDVNVRPGLPGERVDKFFGTKLPPTCARLGCYRTDDGKRFYCVVPTCQKHRRRATKHNRVRPVRKKEDIAFRCPRCGRRDVDVRDWGPKYGCRPCGYLWDP